MQTGYEVKKTLWRGAQIFIFGGMGALLSWLYGLPSTETIIAVIALCKMIQNVYKMK